MLAEEGYGVCTVVAKDPRRLFLALGRRRRHGKHKPVLAHGLLVPFLRLHFPGAENGKHVIGRPLPRLALAVTSSRQ